jgi:hypothetical protein
MPHHQDGQPGLAVVTGASSGIGAAYAERLGADGWDLLLTARDGRRLDERASRIRSQHGVEVTVQTADLSAAGDIEMLGSLLESLPVTMLVNNAGVAEYMPFAELPTETLTRLVTLDVLAPVRLTRAVLPAMVARRRGDVVTIASLLAFSGSWPGTHLPARASYAAAKSFLVTFSQLLNTEVREHGVRVQVCCPGVVRTEFHERQGIDMSSTPRMEPADVVTASLADLEAGAVMSVPGLDDLTALDELDEALRAFMRVSRNTELPARYSG